MSDDHAYLLEWHDGCEPRRRVQLGLRIEPWLEQQAPKITALVPAPEPLREANGWTLQSSIYEGFTTEIWADGREPGKRTVALVRDYQDALTIMAAIAKAEAASQDAA